MSEAEPFAGGDAVRRHRRRGSSILLWIACGTTALLPPYRLVRLRTTLLRLAGVQIGAGSVVAGRIWIAGGPAPVRNLSIGRYCFLNDDVTFDTTGLVTICDDVDIGHGVAFITSSHELGDGAQRAGRTIDAPVTVDKGCWICSRATILPGVVIGSHSVVAAGSVVTAPVPANTMVGGSPARPLRTLAPSTSSAR